MVRCISNADVESLLVYSSVFHIQQNRGKGDNSSTLEWLESRATRPPLLRRGRVGRECSGYNSLNFL